MALRTFGRIVLPPVRRQRGGEPAQAYFLPDARCLLLPQVQGRKLIVIKRVVSRFRRMRTSEDLVLHRQELLELQSFVKCLEDCLVLELFFGGRILENAGASRLLVASDFFLDRLRLGETMVQHTLVVIHQCLLRTETRGPVVLRLAEYVVFLLPGRTIGVAAPRAVLHHVRILSQSVIESTLLVSRQMLCAQSAAVPGDVHIATTAIVGVNDWSGMQVGQRFTRPLLLIDEGA